MGNQTVKMPDDIPDTEVLATYSGALKKAWDFRISGEKRVRKKGFGRGEEAMEEGCALFDRAATQFKLAKEPDEAAKCYARVAECAKSVGDMMKAANAYVKGGETMHQGHKEKTKEEKKRKKEKNE